MEDKLKQLEMKLRVWYGVWLDSRTKKYLYKLYEKNPNEAMRIIGEINRRSKELLHDEYGYRVMVDDKGKLYFRLACPECGSIEFVEDIERVRIVPTSYLLLPLHPLDQKVFVAGLST